MAGKQSFVWTYLEEDGHLRRYAHDSCSSTQGCHVGRKKGGWRRVSAIRSLTTTDSRCLPSDPSLRTACWRTSLGLLPETCCFLPGLLCGFFLDPPGSCTLSLPKISLAAPDLWPWTIRTLCNGTTAGSRWWLSLLYTILASFYCYLKLLIWDLDLNCKTNNAVFEDVNCLPIK